MSANLSPGFKDSLVEKIRQRASDKLLKNGVKEFIDKVKETYPTTSKVVGVRTAINEIGGSEQGTYLFLHIFGTCLQENQRGGRGRRRTRKTRQRNKGS